MHWRCGWEALRLIMTTFVLADAWMLQMCSESVEKIHFLTSIMLVKMMILLVFAGTIVEGLLTGHRITLIRADVRCSTLRNHELTKAGKGAFQSRLPRGDGKQIQC